jgi:hypothetical protein
MGLPLLPRETSEIHAQPWVTGDDTEWVGGRGGVCHSCWLDATQPEREATWDGMYLELYSANGQDQC